MTLLNTFIFLSMASLNIYANTVVRIEYRDNQGVGKGIYTNEFWAVKSTQMILFYNYATKTKSIFDKEKKTWMKIGFPNDSRPVPAEITVVTKKIADVECTVYKHPIEEKTICLFFYTDPDGAALREMQLDIFAKVSGYTIPGLARDQIPFQVEVAPSDPKGFAFKATKVSIEKDNKRSMRDLFKDFLAN